MKLDIVAKDYSPMEIQEPFSVCMTVKNEAATIVRFLNSMFSQTLWPNEIVIVDGGSTDETCNRIRMYRDIRINLIEVPCSPAQGRNLASKSARHNLQVMIDAGTVLDKNLFANLMGPMAEGADITAGIYLPVVDSPWSKYFIPDWKNEAALKKSFLPSCRSAAITRTLFRKTGGFPEQLKQRWGEDTRFMLKAKSLSDRWVLNRKAIVRWNAPCSFDEARELAYRYGMGNGEIGCSEYSDWYRSSDDPVLKSALEGYEEGCRLREACA